MMKSMRGANAYARVGVESKVLSASPHQLITLLFEGADTAIKAARLHMQAGNIEEKGKSIAKVLSIINEGLLAGLDIENGGDIAESLAQLYGYLSRLVLKASLENDVSKLDEAAEILESIASAWREVGLGKGQ